MICYANKSLKENTGIILTTSYSPLVYVVEKDQRATADQQLEMAVLLGAEKEVGGCGFLFLEGSTLLFC